MRHPLRAWAWVLVACNAPPELETIEVDGGSYTLMRPDGVDPATAPVLVHLHANGLGALTARREGMRDDLASAGLVGVFPEGWGEDASTDWNVGDNRHDIPRDDVAFLEAVGADLLERLTPASLWLGGASKGGAMTYELACLGDSGFDGFVPMSGAIEKELPRPCTHPSRPVRHLQGRNDPDHWPLWTADRPESSHMGIMDSLLELTTTDEGCLDTPVVDDGTCATWACADTVQLCWYDGGHRLPGDWVRRQADAIEALSAP